MVLSRKRSSLDSDSEAPSKRARFDDDGGSWSRVSSKGHSIAEECGPSGVATQDGPAPLSQMLLQTQPQPLCEVPIAEPSTVEQPPVPLLDDDLTKDFLSQLDFSIPQPPLFGWDDCLFGGTSEASLIEYSSLDFGNELCSGLPRDFGNVSSSQDSAIPTSERPWHSNSGADCEGVLSIGDLKVDTHHSGIGLSAPPGDLQSSTLPTDSISFSEFDLAFLKSLNGDPRPCASDVQAPPFTSLVDGTDLWNPNDFERQEGNSLLLLLAEAQEVYGC